MGDTNHPAGTGGGKQRSRLIIDTRNDAISQAAERLAAKETIRQGRRVSKSEVVEAILLEGLATELRELREAGDKPTPKPKRKPKL